MEHELFGVAVSKGMASGEVIHLQPLVFDPSPQKTSSSSEHELDQFFQALQAVDQALNRLRHYPQQRLGQDHQALIEAHLQILHDPEWSQQVETLIKTQHVSASYAFYQVWQSSYQTFQRLKVPYFQERALDINDVGQRVMCALENKPFVDLTLINKPVIIVAYELTPSQTLQMNPVYVKGFVCEVGGPTSHTAIVAQTLNIPALVGIKDVLTKIKPGDFLYLNANQGVVGVNYDDEHKQAFLQQTAAWSTYQQQLQVFKDQPGMTADGYRCLLELNIGGYHDLATCQQNQIQYDGVGLVRTEMVYLNQDYPPTEEEQYQIYKAILAAQPTKLTVIRTLDIGGDKQVSYLQLPEKELNPFLGVRAIRFCLQTPEVFRTQLRALLRASQHGRLAIMFPMISTLTELRQAKAMLAAEAANLQAKGVKISADIPVGIMIEVPAAALLAEQFAQEADFFSIGTNDLIQYTLAADRMNPNLTYLYQEQNPAILRLIAATVKGAHAHGRQVTVCGEMAGHLDTIPLLLGLGVDALSMTASKILAVKHKLHNLNRAACQAVARQALALSTTQEVQSLVQTQLTSSTLKSK